MAHTPLRRTISPIFTRNDIPTEEELLGGWTGDESPYGEAVPLCKRVLQRTTASGETSTSKPSTSTVAASKRASQEPDDVHHKKKLRLLISMEEVVTFFVGPSAVPLTIHRDVLLSATPGHYHMQGNWPDSPEPQNGYFLASCPDTWRTAFYWMYHNEICISSVISERSSKHPNPLETAVGLFVKLYIVGADFYMARLCNDALDALLSRAQTIDLVKLSTYAYANTKSGSNLRKLLVKVVSSRYDADDLNEHKKLICADFLFDLAKAAFRDRDQGFNRFRDRLPPQEGFCVDFHVHGKGEKKCEMMKGFDVAEEPRMVSAGQRI